MNKLFVLNCVTAIALFASYAQAKPVPHFYLQLENNSDKAVTLSFISKDGNTYLNPNLNNQLSLSTHQQTPKYQVYFKKLDPAITFDVAFKGKAECTFTVGYFAPGNPKISMSGFGCNGGGYKIIDNGTTLLLYVSSIHLKS